MLKNFSKKIVTPFKIFNRINKINLIKPKFVFFSENKFYQKYAYPLIESLSKKYPMKVYYISSDKNDFIENLEIKNIYVGKNFLLQYFFRNIVAENFFITLTDLDNSIFKKSKFVKNYIYFFHGAVSTTKIYTTNAFDNYDTILCNGEYHIKEIQQREKLENLNKKKLIKTGFFFFDYLLNKIDYSIDGNEILVAPSWNKNKINYINEDFEKIIDKLISIGHIVRFRPHPEIIKRSPNLMKYYKKKFENKNFIYDNDPENFNAMQDAKCLITDNSGISIEYIMLFKKPVIYYNNFEKIHNEKFHLYKDFNTIEDKIKNEFGFEFNEYQILEIDNIIKKSIKDFETKKQKIDFFLKNNFYNVGNSVNFFENNLTNICN